MADIPESTKMDAVDILKTYADFIRNDVRADDLERHPYLPHIEQTIEDLRAAPPAMDREAVYRQALEDVCNPLGYLQRMADAEGAKLSGMAYAIASDIGTIQRIAKRALSTLSADAIRQGEGATTEQFAVVPDGWKLVPIEPTREMIRAGMISRFNLGDQARRIWRDMLAATPASHASDGGASNA